MTAFRSTTAPALTCLAVLLLTTGCPQPARRKGLMAPLQSSAEEAKKILPIEVEEDLPPPTMEPKALRTALWDIQARQRRGDAGKALSDLADRAEADKTLESRFLAAIAIPDDEAQWKALYEIGKKQKKFYWVHAGIATVYAKWKVRDQAEKELNLCFELGPDISYTYTLRGNLYRNLGEYNLAVRDYATALRADASDAEARTGLALARKAQGQADGLRGELERALRDLPSEYEAAEALALLLDEQNLSGPALNAWAHVESLYPKNRSAKLALARLRGDEDVKGAINSYEQASKLQPLTKNEQAALARLYQKDGQTEKETKTLQSITKLDPKDLGPWRRLAEIFEQKGEWAPIESTYRSILGLEPKDAAALYGLGRLAEKRGMLREAIEYFRSVKAVPDDRATGDLVRLVETCMLPQTPLAGSNLTNFYRSVSGSLEKLYTKRLAERPTLKGSMKAKIQTDGQGRALSIEVVESTLQDPVLEAHLHFALLEAVWPKLKDSDPKRFSLKFDLPPLKE